MNRSTLKRVANAIVGETAAYKLARLVEKKDPKEVEADLARQRFYGTFVKKGDLCFDVGANVGNRVGPLLSVGARVVAVEPQPGCQRVLRLRFGKRITVVPKGLATKEGTMQMHLSENHVLSSFSQEWIDAVKSARFNNTNWDKTITVPMTTLDTLIAEHGRPHFIKIDVEGFETEVLGGLTSPVPWISFEYTVPEQSDKAVACVEIIHRNDPSARFNYSKGESMVVALDQWMSAAEMITHITGDVFRSSGFGDIYARGAGH